MFLILVLACTRVHNPVGVEDEWGGVRTQGSPASVEATPAAQPWAARRNPFGVSTRKGGNPFGVITRHDGNTLMTI